MCSLWTTTVPDACREIIAIYRTRRIICLGRCLATGEEPPKDFRWLRNHSSYKNGWRGQQLDVLEDIQAQSWENSRGCPESQLPRVMRVRHITLHRAKRKAKMKKFHSEFPSPASSSLRWRSGAPTREVLNANATVFHVKLGSSKRSLAFTLPLLSPNPFSFILPYCSLYQISQIKPQQED